MKKIKGNVSELTCSEYAHTGRWAYVSYRYSFNLCGTVVRFNCFNSNFLKENDRLVVAGLSQDSFVEAWAVNNESSGEIEWKQSYDILIFLGTVLVLGAIITGLMVGLFSPMVRRDGLIMLLPWLIPLFFGSYMLRVGFIQRRANRVVETS